MGSYSVDALAVRRAPGISIDDPAPTPLQSLVDKLVRLLPVEVVSGYTTVDAFARSAPEGAVRVIATALTVCLFLALIPTVFTRLREVPGKTPNERFQRLVAIGAFYLWTYATGGFWLETGTYQGWIAGALSAVFLFLVLLYTPPRSPRPEPPSTGGEGRAGTSGPAASDD